MEVNADEEAGRRGEAPAAAVTADGGVPKPGMGMCMCM